MYTSILQAQLRLRAYWFACLAVTVAATLPFLGTLNDYYISDDFGVLSLFSQKPALHFLTLFTSPWTEAIYGGWTDELRPTLALTFQLAWFLGGGAPLAFHISVLAFHLATALLVLGIARVPRRVTTVNGSRIQDSAAVGTRLGVRRKSSAGADAAAGARPRNRAQG
jgi:hypothetical protein